MKRRTEDLKWTLREAESRTGIRNAHLSQIETGVISRPDPGILWKLSDVYGLDFGKLMKLAGHAGGRGDEATRKVHAEVAYRTVSELSRQEREDALAYLRQIRERGQPHK